MVVVGVVLELCWDFVLVIDTGNEEGVFVHRHHVDGRVGTVVFDVGEGFFGSVDEAVFIDLG